MLAEAAWITRFTVGPPSAGQNNPGMTTLLTCALPRLQMARNSTLRQECHSSVTRFTVGQMKKDGQSRPEDQLSAIENDQTGDSVTFARDQNHPVCRQEFHLLTARLGTGLFAASGESESD